MSACPELAVLEEVPLAPPIRAHVAACTACRLVVEVFASTTSGDAECLRFDALLAGRAEGTLNAAGKHLLARHLASCAACREVAETLSPLADNDGDLAALPRVDSAGYALGLEIARGGMGRILAARDLRIGRPVAVKELLGRSPALAARFEREARVTARLQHPGIVPIYEIGRWPDGTPFYSMRMVEGRTLLEAIDAATTLAARLALLPAVIAATEAVAFAHAQRVIHRDLTPSNVLVGAYGETVVIDWGLAKDLSPDAPRVTDEELDPAGDGSVEHLTGAGAVIGTAAYMPPEQAHAVPVDERADVYALGSILYHLLAGVAPYRARSTRALLREVKLGPPPPVGELAPGAPRDLVSIVTKAMARDPEDRYPTARELTEELKRFQTGRMVAAHAYSRGDRVLRFVRRNRGVLAVTALAVVLLGAGGAIAVSRVLRSRGEAREMVRELFVEEGRVELVNGNPLRALAYLYEAYAQGVTSPSLGFLIASAQQALPRSRQLLDCGSDVRYVDLSPDGTRVIAACHDVARMWNVADHGSAPVFSLGGSPAGFDRVAFVAEGASILTWGEGGVAQLWSASTGRLQHAFAHGAGINLAMLTPDRERLVTFGQDGTAQVFLVATGARERTIVAATGLFRHVYGAISADGRRLFTLGMDGDGKAWDLHTGAFLGGFPHADGALVLGADVSRDGTHAVTCGTDRLTRIWDTTTGANLRTLGGHSGVVWKCMFSPDGTRLMTAGDDETALIWDLTTGQTVTSVHHGDIVLWGRFSPDGRRFFTVGVDGVVKIWDVLTGALLASHDSIGGKDAHWGADGRLLAAQRGDGRIEIWDEDPETPASFAPPPGTTVLAVSGDGLRTAVERDDGWVHLYETSTGRALPHAPIHAPVSFSSTGSLAAMGDGAVLILDPATGATLHAIPRTAPVTQLELSADGHRLVITGASAELWDVATASRLAVIPEATHARPSRGGVRVLAWREGEPPFVWDVMTRRRLSTLDVSPGFVVVGFSGDDRRVAIVEPKLRRLTLWDAERTRAPLVDALDNSVAPTWDPTGAWLTTIGPDGAVTVWTGDGAVKTQFVADQLLQAEANHDATLIAGIGDNGTSMIVLSADGRLLERIPIDHRPPIVWQDGFHPPVARAGWSSDGRAIVIQSRSIVVVPATTELAPQALEAVMATSVRWRVDHGRLVWIDKVRLHGRVVGAGEASVMVEIRTPAHAGARPIDVPTMTMEIETVPAIVHRDGSFELARRVPPGTYKVTATHGDRATTVVADVGAEDREVTVDLSQ